MPGLSDDDPMKSSPSSSSTPQPPPPAAHCRVTPPLTSDDIKPLDLSIKQNEQQPLNLCSKRKRHTPVSLSKRTNPGSTSSLSNSIPTTTATDNNNPNSSSSMFIPFYTLSPFVDPNLAMNQQELFQQMQTFYLQLQEKFHKK